MRRKIDWDSIVKSAIIFGIIIGAIYFLEFAPGFFHLVHENKLDTQTKAQVIKLNKIFGNPARENPSVKAVFIEYRYKVGDSAYFGNDIIPYSGYRNTLWIDSLLHTRADSVWILYNSDEPGKSLLKT